MSRSRIVVWIVCLSILAVAWWLLDRFLGFERYAAVLIAVVSSATLGVIAARLSR